MAYPAHTPDLTKVSFDHPKRTLMPMTRRVEDCKLTSLEGLAMIEQRRTLRLYEPISLAVRGEQGKGDRFEFETVARDVSGGGLCAVAPRILRTGDRLRFTIQFARAGTRPFRAPTVATQGVVLRVQELSDGTFLFAAVFTMRGVM